MLKSTLCAGVAVLALGTAAAKADIVIAVAGPMTGSYASFGEQALKGAEFGWARMLKQLSMVLSGVK